MRCIVRQDERLLMWAGERLEGQVFDPRDCTTLAFADDEALRAVAIYQPCTLGGPSLSIATDGTTKWCRRAVLKRIFDYPFLQCGYERITMLVEAGNERSQKLVAGVGAQREGVMRRAGKNGAVLIIYGLLATERRF